MTVDAGTCRTICSCAAAVAQVLLPGARTGIGDDVRSGVCRGRNIHRRIDMITLAGHVSGTRVGFPARASRARATGASGTAARGGSAAPCAGSTAP